MKYRQLPQHKHPEHFAVVRYLSEPLKQLKEFLGRNGYKDVNVTMHGFEIRQLKDVKQESHHFYRFHD